MLENDLHWIYGLKALTPHQCQVVSQQLHDESGVFVGVLVEGVELGDGVVEGGLGQVTGLLRGVLDLVALTISIFFSLPSAEVFCSMLEITLQEERRAPTTFL
ncbi:hypothetical protein EYF80_027701 [Liparis tanakae]|uniref:Uncharacterized protein n=1 Tax=Liparis tanakae TaxID=230148 RepID=A0A4Z2H8F9_9TELE|nr:hypothetical protein EYF80_027701 [Liparis tanakae]